MNQKPQTDAQLLATMRDLVKVQQANQAVKEKELAVEQERIKSNEKIALASIEAQKGDRNEQIKAVSKMHTQRNIIIGIVIVAVVAVIFVSMFTNNTAFALEVLKIGGALLAGYIAGFGRGKNAVFEQQKRNEEE